MQEAKRGKKKKINDSNTKERSIKVLHQIQPQKIEKKRKEKKQQKKKKRKKKSNTNHKIRHINFLRSKIVR